MSAFVKVMTNEEQEVINNLLDCFFKDCFADKINPAKFFDLVGWVMIGKPNMKEVTA